MNHRSLDLVNQTLMFCPKCGKSEQIAETYCRQCGIFLPDLSKAAKKEIPPAEHVRTNLILNAMTVVTSFTLAILLYSMVAFRDNTHWLIYLTAGLLIAMGCWHTQTLWRSILLRRHFNKFSRPTEAESLSVDKSAITGKILPEANLDNIVPFSVTDRTTKHLSGTRPHSSQTEHKAH